MLEYKQAAGLDLFDMDFVEKGAEKEENCLCGYFVRSFDNTNIYQL